MEHYYAAARRELKALRGKEVVTTGDGLMATFRAPDAGIRCATAIRETVRTLGLEIRGGLHAGEYKVSGKELVGLAVHIGARVAAKARPGEVLVLERGQGSDGAVRHPIYGPRRAPAQRRAEAMAPVPGGALKSRRLTERSALPIGVLPRSTRRGKTRRRRKTRARLFCPTSQARRAKIFIFPKDRIYDLKKPARLDTGDVMAIRHQT